MRPLAGAPVCAWSLRAARAARLFDRVVMVVPPDALGAFAIVAAAEMAASRDEPGAPRIEIVAGGATRTASSAAGLEAAGEATHVLVHDAARPFASPALFGRVAAVTRAHGAALPVVPVVDTVKEIETDGDGERVARTLPRARLRAAQTPQGFRADWLREALARAGAAGDAEGFTDDAGLVEALGRPVRAIAGEAQNFKITTALDLTRAEIFARRLLDKNLSPA